MHEFEEGLSYRSGFGAEEPSAAQVVPRKELVRLAPDILPYLRPGDRVTKLQLLEIRMPARPSSALRELLALAEASTAAELGERGPVKASRVTDENIDVSPELRIFETVFARDALRVALFLAEPYPRLARATVLALGAAQGVQDDPVREEEPGRIPHELRAPDDPIAQRISQVLGWGWPYYGSVDATPLFIQAVVVCWRHDPRLLEAPVQGRDGRARRLADCLDGAVAWLCRRLDSSSLGLLEYRPSRQGSIENQVWRDSWDAYVHADGQLANHNGGIAALEAQALTYDALAGAVQVRRAQGRDADADELERRALGVRDAVTRLFWVDGEGGGFFAMGLDRDPAGAPRPLAVRTSDMGHLLCSGVLDGDAPDLVARREQVVRGLFGDELLCAAGLRSIASTAIRFHPGGYHLGSSWLWDTCLVANGLDRHGYHGLAEELRARCLAVVEQYRKFPEYARGGEQDEPALTTRLVDIWSAADQRLNRFEQPPQEVQAWTVAAVLDAKRRNGRRALGRPGALPRRARGRQRALEAELLDGRVRSDAAVGTSDLGTVT
jgi:glycogen debranching enzyme